MRLHACIWGLFAAYFLVLFAPLPIAGTIPGNIDTWYAIAFTNVYLNEVREALGWGAFGSFLHPAEHPLSYGETAFGLAALPMALRALGISDVLTYYLFLSVAYATTAFAVYLLATLYVRHRALAAVAGLTFSSTTFLLSTIDSPHTAFFGVAFASLYFFKRYVLDFRGRDLWWSALLAGLQTYFSAYLFLLLAIALIVVGLANVRRLVGNAGIARLAAYAALVGVLVAPFYISYLLRLDDYVDLQFQAVLFAEFNSLDIQDLWNPMPGNLVYPEGDRFDAADAVALRSLIDEGGAGLDPETAYLFYGAMTGDEDELLWVSSRRRAFVGTAVALLAVYGVLLPFAGRGELAALFLTGLVLALGPANIVDGQVVRMPAYALYEYVPGFHMFRIPGRAFALALLAIAIFAAHGAGALAERFATDERRGARVAALLLGLLLVIENVPVPMRSFEAAALVRPPPDYASFFADKDDTVVLNLPSGIGYGLGGSANDLNVFNRELIYINWQTYHGQNIVNGVNGYIPHARMRWQRSISRLPSRAAVDEIVAGGIDFVVFNRELVLPGEAHLLDALRGHPDVLALVHESDTTAVFEVKGAAKPSGTP